METLSSTQPQHHCLQCGNAMKWQPADGRWREVCPRCGWIYYQQLKVGAAALVEKNDCLLLLRRSQDPWKGAWNLPAGYVEADEDPAMAAERETLEETGYRVRAGELLAAHFFDDDRRGNGILLVYQCEIIAGKIQYSSEVSEIGFFNRNEIPENLAGAGHTQTIRDWQMKS